MSHNSFGHLFRVTTWGESHGPAIGCVVDGTPPGLSFTEAEIQAYLDKRRPGQSRFTTQRREPDEVKVLSGVMPGEAEGELIATGTPIAMEIRNVDQRSKDYSDIAQRYRPGHADITYDMKYGLRDHRGGGRSSARETAVRVAAGALARRIVPGLVVRGALIQIGSTRIDRSRFDWAEVENNPFFCPDAETAERWADELDAVRKSGSSIGAVVEIVAEGVPAGLGAPLYGKLDQDIAGHLMSINAGGILGGISTGQPVVGRFAVKPTSSILTPRRSIDTAGQEVDVMTRGRHDPCVGIRAVPIGEAMVACAIADHYLRHRAQTGRGA